MAFDAGAVVSRMELGLSGWKKSVEEVKKDQQSLSGFAMRHRDEIEKLGKAFTIVGGAIVASLGAAVIKTANFGDAINDMSQRTGVSTELLSGYKLAADNSGTSIEGLASGLKLLSRNMFDTSLGTGEAKDAFDFLGISVVNADGTLRDSNEVMLDVAERFKGMENGAQKTALSMDIFGKSGADLIPMLNMGRAGLRGAYEDAERFGMIVSKEAAAAADEFNDSLGNMKSALGGAGRQLGEALIPAVQGGVEKITEIVVKVKDWAGEHPELFKSITLITGGLGGLMLAVGPLLIALPKMIEGFQFLKTTLSNINPVTAITTGLFATLAIKILEYKQVLDDLKGQIGKNTEIDKNWSDQQDRSALVLANAAREAGWLRGRMQELIEAYDGNLAALQRAIKEGKHGVEIQEALKGAGERVNDMLQRQKGAFGGLTPTIEKTSGSMGNLNEKVKKFIELIPTALGKARDIQVPIEELGVTALDTSKDIGADLYYAIQNLPQPKLDTDKFESGCNAMEQAWANMVTNIAQGWSAAFVDMFGLTEALIGEATKHIQEYFDGAYADLAASKEAQLAAYEGVYEAIQETYRKAKDEVSAYYDELDWRANDALEDEKKRMRREYEDKRDYIMATVPAGAERDEMLKALAREYEDAIDALERQHEAEDRQRKADELAAVEALNAQKKAEEEALAAEKLAIEEAYQAELERIKADEERSREEHAASELRRQNSLWTKVKTVFGNAIEGMMTAWLTQLVTPLLASITGKILPGMDKIGEKGVDVGETAGKALSGIGKAIEDIVTAILDVIEDIAKTVVDIVAYAIETLAESIANAANSLAAAAPSLLIVGGIALALYAGFQAINSLIGSGGGGSGDGMGRVVERQDRFLAVWDWWAPDVVAILSFIQGQNDHRADQLDNLAGSVNSAADRIVDAIAGIPGAAEGALVTGPTLVRVGENAPHEEEVIMPLPELGAFARNMAAAGAGAGAYAGAGEPRNVQVHIKPILIDKGDKWMIKFIQEKVIHGDLVIPINRIGAPA